MKIIVYFSSSFDLALRKISLYSDAGLQDIISGSLYKDDLLKSISKE